MVEKTLSATNFSADQQIVDKRTGKTFSLNEFLSRKASISQFSRKFLLEVAGELADPKQASEDFEVWDLIKTYGNPYDVQTFCDRLMPLLPRLYSIASSPKMFPDEIHLVVAEFEYETLGEARSGICTRYLCEIAPLNEPAIPIYVHPHKGFTTPKEPSTPIILVGPGTGVAPFRGFMQERYLQNAKNNWLFFGEWTHTKEFFYQKEWENYVQQGFLKLDTAFSRDQPEKVYVQNRLIEKGAEVMTWLENGAIFYVCGDAKHMARDVDDALHQIIQDHSTHHPGEYVKAMKSAGRYLKDVY